MLAGGDMWETQGPLIVLRGRQVLRLTRDNEWHHIDLRRAHGVARATVDGVEVGTAAVPHPPDSIEVGTRNPNAGQQTEIFVRDIAITKNNKLVGSKLPALPSDRPTVAAPSSKTNAASGAAIKPTEPRTLATQSKGLVAVTSDSAIKLYDLRFRYIDSYNLKQVRGLLSHILGVWVISAELVNDSDKVITVIPGVLTFDNHAFEGLYPQVGWKYYIHDVSFNGGTYGAIGPDIQFTADYFSPVAGMKPLTRLEPGKRTTIDLYAENGGGWQRVARSSQNGRISTSSVTNEPVSRNPVGISLLCVSDPETLQKRLDSFYNSLAISDIESPNTVDCCRALDGLKRQLKSPPPKDPLWVNIPINKETLSLEYQRAMKVRY
jgi:hypothetical protein